MSTSSKSKPKLSPVILEAIARNLSDHDLLRFMLSSKEAFNATLDVLSSVDYVNIHDENFENEPCIAFGIRGDLKNKSELSYITQFNPLFNFFVNNLKGQITEIKTCNLVEIEPWLLNALITFRLKELSLGIVLPKSCKKILKHAPKLTKVIFSTFDVFVSNNFIPFRCKMIAVDYLELYEMKKIVALPFSPSNFVENISLGESKLFVMDYDIYCDDFIQNHWKDLINFLISSFPFLKVLDIQLGGYTDFPVNVLNWWNGINDYIHSLLPSEVKFNITFNVLIPANKWLAFCIAFADIDVSTDNNLQPALETDETSFNNLIRSYIKNRRFPDDIDTMVCQDFHNYPQESSIGLKYYAKWEEYDFDVINNQQYNMEIIHPIRHFYAIEEVSSSVNTVSTQRLSERSELELVTAREEFWNHENQVSDFDDTLKCVKSLITDSSRSLITQAENSVKSNTETDTTSTSEDSTSDDEDSDTSLDSIFGTNSYSSNETTLTDDDSDETDTETSTTSECSTCAFNTSTQDSSTDRH